MSHWIIYALIVSKKIFAQRSLGNPKIPLEMAGRDIDSNFPIFSSASFKLTSKRKSNGLKINESFEMVPWGYSVS